METELKGLKRVIAAFEKKAKAKQAKAQVAPSQPMTGKLVRGIRPYPYRQL